MTSRWPLLSAADTAAALATDPEQGLSTVEAAARLVRDGPNTLATHTGPRWPRLLLGQFRDVMIVLLLAAAGLSLLVGDGTDAIMIGLIVVLNAAIGFTQELRAARAVGELRRMAVSSATVVRDGVSRRTPTRDIVVGDLLFVEPGAHIAADLRLTAVHDLEIDESALTGEALPAHKTIDVLHDEGAGLGDQVNCAFSGTIATRGTGRGLATATGDDTELGQIAALIAAVVPTPTPLQGRLARVSRVLAIGAVAISVIVFATGVLRGQPAILMLLTAISLAVAAIPEAMPAVVTVLLAVGARSMARHHALVRRLSAVETLGSVTYVCVDKTGTLTMNRMVVTEVSSANLPALLQAMALCNDADADAAAGAQGDPTEVALAAYAASRGSRRRQLEQTMPRRATYAFTASRKRMTTVHAGEDAAPLTAYLKGAPEILLQHAPDVHAEARAMAQRGLRVMAFARQPADGTPDDDVLSGRLEVLGCVGLMDPPRAESAAAVAACRAAGITTVMITGDHADTAEAIAREIGLLRANEDGAAISGAALAALDDAGLAGVVLTTRVYARVDPAQKLRIVAALQSRGQFVAMTGDGVNDAPALARADIGVAMGRSGTDVAREAADLVLLDDNFASIVAAIREGRRIYANVQKFIRYVLACNLAEVLTVFLAPLLGMAMPLLPVQLLWINLVTDGLPGLALAFEPADATTMSRPPQPPQQGLFDRGMWSSIALMGGVMAAVTLAVQATAAGTGPRTDQTMVFTVLTLLQVGQALAVRSHTTSLLTMPVFGNRPLIAALALTVLLQLLAVYTSLGNRYLHTVPLTAMQLGVCTGAASTGLLVSEVIKGLRRRSTRRIE